MPTEKQHLFTAAKSHTICSFSDVTVEVFVDAVGVANIVLPTHCLFLVESQSVVMRSLNDEPAVRREYLKPLELLFAPKHTLVHSEPVTPLNITVIRIPDARFRNAVGSDYDTVQFTRFESSPDMVLTRAASLLKELAIDGHFNSDLSEALIDAIVQRVLAVVWPKLPARKPEVLTDALVDLVTTYINRHIGRIIRLSELAELANLSQFHFTRVFRRKMNATPMRYVLERRVEAAKRMLAGTESLASIALDTGFSSQSHLTTAFKAATGVTPAAFRLALSLLPPWLVAAFLYLPDLVPALA